MLFQQKQHNPKSAFFLMQNEFHVVKFEKTVQSVQVNMHI